MMKTMFDNMRKRFENAPDSVRTGIRSGRDRMGGGMPDMGTGGGGGRAVAAQVGARPFHPVPIAARPLADLPRGGEPTERDDLLELVEYSRQVGLRAVMATCGYAIDDATLAKLKDAGVLALNMMASPGGGKMEGKADRGGDTDGERVEFLGDSVLGMIVSEILYATCPHEKEGVLTEIKSTVVRRKALAKLLPMQREDFIGIFRAMDGLPVIIRLIDPPLHEFLPNHLDLLKELSDLKIRMQHAADLETIDDLLEAYGKKTRILKRVENLREENPMLGLRGVRLGMLVPELTTMQVRAIFEAACRVAKEGVDVHPEIMIPLIGAIKELKLVKDEDWEAYRESEYFKAHERVTGNVTALKLKRGCSPTQIWDPAISAGFASQSLLASSC